MSERSTNSGLATKGELRELEKRWSSDLDEIKSSLGDLAKSVGEIKTVQAGANRIPVGQLFMIVGSVIGTGLAIFTFIGSIGGVFLYQIWSTDMRHETAIASVGSELRDYAGSNRDRIERTDTSLESFKAETSVSLGEIETQLHDILQSGNLTDQLALALLQDTRRDAGLEPYPPVPLDLWPALKAGAAESR